MAPKASIAVGAFPCINRFRGHGPLLQRPGPFRQGPPTHDRAPTRTAGVRAAPWAPRAFVGTIAAFRIAPLSMNDRHHIPVDPRTSPGAA